VGLVVLAPQGSRGRQGREEEQVARVLLVQPERQGAPVEQGQLEHRVQQERPAARGVRGVRVELEV